MARRGEPTDLEDRPTGPDRLRSMQLRSDRAGWVPEPPAAQSPDLTARPASEPEPNVAPVMPPTAGDLARSWIQDRVPPWASGMVERASVGSVLAGLAAAVAVGLGGVMVLHHRSAATYPPSYDASATGAAGATPIGGSGSTFAGPTGSPPPTPGVDGSSIVVDVGGRVRKPGLVTLPPGARVADAIKAAGGPLRHREITTIDLAARVADGQLLLVGMKAADPAAAAGVGVDPTSTASAVALNSATLDQLETLPGIGPVLGQNIIDWRTTHSGFTSIEQLQQVSGIGPATYAELSPLVTL